MKEPIKATDNNFEETVLNSTGVLVVMFWARWCGRCSFMLSETIKPMSRSRRKHGFELALAEESDCPVQLRKHDVMGYPTYAVYVDGVRRGTTFMGAMPREEFLADIKRRTQ